MRYHTIPSLNDYAEKDIFRGIHCIKYSCKHPVYDQCALYLSNGNKGLAVVQQFFDEDRKSTFWYTPPAWICEMVYRNNGFPKVLSKLADLPQDGLYPTIPIRKLMWMLRMKPLKKERWETTFDRRLI